MRFEWKLVMLACLSRWLAANSETNWMRAPLFVPQTAVLLWPGDSISRLAELAGKSKALKTAAGSLTRHCRVSEERPGAVKFEPTSGLALRKELPCSFRREHYELKFIR